MKVKCCCCKKILKQPFANTKYCSTCSLYTKELRRKISYLGNEVKRLRKIVYGQKRGWERLR